MERRQVRVITLLTREEKCVEKGSETSETKACMRDGKEESLCLSIKGCHKSLRFKAGLMTVRILDGT